MKCYIERMLSGPRGMRADRARWRTSTAIPNMICAVMWSPIHFGVWLIRAIALLMRTVIIGIASLIGAFLVLSGAIVGWQQGLLGLICLACVLVIVLGLRFEDWQRR